MSVPVLAAAVMAGLAAALTAWSARHPSLAAAVGAPPRRATAAAGKRSPVQLLVVAGAAAAALVLVAGPALVVWLGCGTVAAALARRRAVAIRDAERALAVRRQLPLALDLLAAALAAGATTTAAIEVAAEAVGPPLGDRLTEVCRALELGASAEQAWGGLARDPPLEPLVHLAVRAGSGGAALAGACRQLADAERRSLLVEVRRGVRRAGVLATVPLTVCLLPAFVLTGVLPLVVGLLHGLAV